MVGMSPSLGLDFAFFCIFPCFENLSEIGTMNLRNDEQSGNELMKHIFELPCVDIYTADTLCILLFHIPFPATYMHIFWICNSDLEYIPFSTSCSPVIYGHSFHCSKLINFYVFSGTNISALLTFSFDIFSG